MKRRDLIAGLAGVGMIAEAEEPVSESLYIPKPHLVEDRKLLHDFMDEFAFVDLITATPAIRVTHIPVLLDRNAGKFGTISGHIARKNAQAELFDARHPAVVVFRGPHSYISPMWYANRQAVPTWNFAVVHASGTLKPVTDPKDLHDFLATLIHKFEDYEGTGYDFSKLPDSYTYGMIGGIIGFQMEVELLEGKFKLGQDRTEADRASLLKNLPAAKAPESLGELTARFYARFPKV